MPTPKRTHHFNCSTLKQHPAAAPAGQLQSGHATLTAAPCSSSVHPCSTSRVHYVPSLQHPQAPPLQQHQQGSSTAPSSSTFYRHPLTSMPAPKHGLKSSSITFRQHLQQHPERHQHARPKLYTPL